MNAISWVSVGEIFSLLLPFAVAVALAMAAFIVAGRKGRSTLLWCLVCFFFPPAFFLLLILDSLDRGNDETDRLEARLDQIEERLDAMDGNT